MISDSNSALQKKACKKVLSKVEYCAFATKIYILLYINHGNELNLLWIPRHTNITGNEQAGNLSKNGLVQNVVKMLRLNIENISHDMKGFG